MRLVDAVVSHNNRVLDTESGKYLMQMLLAVMMSGINGKLVKTVAVFKVDVCIDYFQGVSRLPFAE